jgi:hypothetical protein
MPNIERVPVLGGKLDEYLCVTQWEVQNLYSLRMPMMDGDTRLDAALRVCAVVKPVGVRQEDSDVTIRHKLLLAYECAVHILEEMQVQWLDYPELSFGGRVVHLPGGGQHLVTEATTDWTMRCPE